MQFLKAMHQKEGNYPGPLELVPVHAHDDGHVGGDVERVQEEERGQHRVEDGREPPRRRQQQHRAQVHREPRHRHAA